MDQELIKRRALSVRNIKKRNQAGIFIRNEGLEKICEVGVRKGDNFRHMLQPCVTEAIAVDIWQDTGNPSENDLGFTQGQLERQYQKFIKDFKGDDRVKAIRKYSHIAAKEFEDEYFDFVYLDADHSYEGLLRDLRAWWPKVKNGGILGGHDYIVRETPVKYGVIEAVTEFLKENNITSEKLHLTGEQFKSYYLVKGA